MKVDEIIKAQDLPIRDFDAIIIGGGGSGMRASLQLAESGLNTAVFLKYSLQDHTPFPHKEVLLVLFKAMTLKMIGVGICSIL